MGYRTVAVFSDADRHARHVQLADEAIHIGAAAVAESYMNTEKLIAAAKRAGAEAIHPGYGFLSENADFARACGEAGLTFIGPSPSAIASMGNKAAAKRLMLDAGVPCVPGYQGTDQTDQRFVQEAAKTGFPVMVKAAAGGGGRGMRLVSTETDLIAALAAARREALAAFGSDELILEKAVVDARHIEIQVFGDGHGNIIHLGERDCSIQRRHQKVIEEAPSPAVSPVLRDAMGAAAVAAARAIAYSGAGTVEFLLAANGDFYFLEMNTRIQVEHPVTEAITGLDLVRWQIDVAAGSSLPLTQAQVRFAGHAIEVRLYAEDPHNGFLPRSGSLTAWTMPDIDGVRVDHGLATAPTEVSAYYDPMIAKIIAHGATREEARRRMMRALEACHVHGIITNRAFLLAMLCHPAVVAGAATIGFIPQFFAPRSAALKRPAPDEMIVALAAALLIQHQSSIDGWRSTGARAMPIKIVVGKAAHQLRVTINAAHQYVVQGENWTHAITLFGAATGSIRFSVDGHMQVAHGAWDRQRLMLDCGHVSTTAEDVTFAPRAADEAAGTATLRAPMNGRIVAVFATAGEVVRKGQRLVVLEAMKMQHEISAERDGTIETLTVKVEEQVATRQVLVGMAVE